MNWRRDLILIMASGYRLHGEKHSEFYHRFVMSS